MPSERPETLDELDSAVRIAVYAAFVEHFQAPDVRSLATSLHRSVADIQDSLRRLAAAHILVLDDDLRIRMAMPFSGVPTPFRVATASGAWFANCAWDALGIPAAL